MVIYGWIAGRADLITVESGFPAMVFNTALGFLLSGFGLIFKGLGWKKVAAFLGALVFTLGFLTFIEHVFGLNLHIDELVFDDFIGTATFPGRMSITTALCFILSGITLFMLGCSSYSTKLSILQEALAAFTVVAAMGSLFEHLVLRDITHVWPVWKSMALHTSAAFVLLNLAMLCRIWVKRESVQSAFYFTVPLFIVLFGLVFDALTPFSVVTGVIYTPLVLCSLWHGHKWAPFFMAFLSSLLTLGGSAFLVEDHPVVSTNFLNLGLAVSGFWITASLVYLIKKKAALSQNNAQKLQSILDSTVDGIITIDERGAIQTYNAACEHLFGYKLSEVVGKNVNMLMPEPYHSEHDNYLKNYLNTGKKRIIGLGRQVQGRNKNGTIFPMDLSVSEVLIDGRRMFSGIVRDISLLQEAQNRLAAILDNTVDGLITIDEFGNMQSFNKACERIFGYKAFEVIGKNVSVLMPQPYREEHDGYLNNYHSTGEKKVIGIGREVQGQRKDGSVFPLDLSVSEVYVGGRKVYSGIVRDISDRKQAEDEILRSNEELERFAYIASHDLQEPLRMVSNFTRLLDDEYGPGMDEQASEYMGFVMDASARMQNLVSDLLEYSRVGAEQFGFSEFDCQEQVEVVLENLNESIRETGAQVNIDPMPRIYGHAQRYSRLVQNLIANAIKYREKDKAPIVHVSAEERVHDWLFKVSDNGIGIKPEYLQQIFVIFKRLHNKQDYSGTGIGLAICKKIVESFGGEIWAESVFGEGSTFIFTIPKRHHTQEQEEFEDDRAKRQAS